jgi:TolA-binding protein
MSEIDETPRSYSGTILGVTIAALVVALGGLIWSYTLSGKLTTQQAQLADAQQQNVKLAAELRETDARLRVATEALGKSLGLTQQQMDSRAEEIVRRQQENEQRAQQMEAAQKQNSQQISAVSSEVSHVKTDVGGVKTDVARTRNDLNSAVAQLTSIRGDLSDHSSLIARNHDELELLKHRGDRNYYEFTLFKGQRKVVGTIGLELKKADMKKNRFTVQVYSDDKKYEKKDRNVNEPLQFYSGRNPLLFEIVVNNIESKNQISGYLATPKGAPVPMVP